MPTRFMILLSLSNLEAMTCARLELDTLLSGMELNKTERERVLALVLYLLSVITSYVLIKTELSTQDVVLVKSAFGKATPLLRLLTLTKVTSALSDALTTCFSQEAKMDKSSSIASLTSLATRSSNSTA